jgi:structural maintenance of chromosome 2
LGDLEEAIRSKNARITEEALEMQKLGHQLEKLHKDQQAAAQMVANMEGEHEWIEEEKGSFGRPNTPYDFRGQNIAECRSTLRNLTERFQGMKKKINPKVMNMIDSVEKKEVALKNMMKTVIRDKKKIEETIINLNEYKKEALHKTWSKVNGDFGQIFAELLPGSFAKLDPPEGKEITDGLEVKVSLGKVWKQSLTELSGGQRSVHFSALAKASRLTTLQFPHSFIPHHGPSTIQASANVYLGRGRCSSRFVPHTEYRSPDQDTVQGIPVHRRFAQRRHVPECQPDFQDALQ